MGLVMRVSKASWGVKILFRWCNGNEPSGIHSEAWSRRTGVSGSVPGKGKGCVRAGLKPDGRMPQQALGQ